MRKPNAKAIKIAFIMICSIGIGFFIVSAIFSSNGVQKFPDGTIVRKNVSILTEETNKDALPIAVHEDQLVFTSKPHYDKGEIVVAGIIDTAPYGFIRKVVKIIQDGNVYIVKTEPAVLTDVFEEAHITKTFSLSDDGIKEVTVGNLSQKVLPPIVATKLSYTPDMDVEAIHMVSQDEYPFETRFNHEITNGMSLDGSVGVDIWLEVKIDITRVTSKESSIDVGVILHSVIDGDIAVGYTATAVLELKKELFAKTYVSSFLIGPVPIVITNELAANLEGGGELQGAIEIGYQLKAEKSTGILYRSTTNKVEEIDEKTFQSDGLKWKTQAKAEGNVSAGITIHLISKLYDSSGLDLSLGVVASAKGEVMVSPKQSLDGLNYAGSLDMEIGPEIKGHMVVTVPVIDKMLVEQPIFVVSLPPWWERHWNSGEIGEEESDTAMAGVENKKTYTTRFANVNMLTYPTFEFEYPDGWTMISERVSETSEMVELSNGDGVIVRYQYIVPAYSYGNMRITMNTETSKVADSNFIPSHAQTTDYSDLGKFVVAKINITSYQNIRTDPEPIQSDSGYYSYAVMPESECGSRSKDGNFVNAFWYDGLLEFKTEAARTLTSKEEQEVIKILASFRISNRKLGDDVKKDINGTYDTSSEWYRTYGKLIKVVQDMADTFSGQVYFQERMPGDITLRTSEKGGASVPFQVKERRLVYALAKVSASKIPMLVIGVRSDEKTFMWAIYEFKDHVADSLYLNYAESENPEYAYFSGATVPYEIEADSLDWEMLDEWDQ